jgi:queuine tRNA-ribosyltransferase
VGGSLGRDKDQMHQVVGWATEELPDDRPRHLLGIGEVDDLIRGVELGIDTFDCAMPTRLARHGMALVPDAAARWRVNLLNGRFRDAREPVLEGCRCAACAGGLSRAYLRHLVKQRELTGMRLLTAHNLVFVADLMARLRAGLAEGSLAETAAALRAGAAPGG